MKKFRKKIWLARLPYLMLLTLIYVGACTSRRPVSEMTEEQQVREEINRLPEQEELIPALAWDIQDVDSIRILFTDDETIQAYLPADKWKELAEALRQAVYDQERNRDGIMINMIAPDYTLIIRYKEKTPEENDWLMWWKESGYVKFQNVWYTLDERKIDRISKLMEHYRK